MTMSAQTKRNARIRRHRRVRKQVRGSAERPRLAVFRSTRKPEPYKGKGVRYAGEKVRRKAGKAGKIGGKK